GAERVAQPRLFRVGAAQRLGSAFLGEPTEDGNTGAARFDRHGQGDALVERTGDERALSVAGASGDAHPVRSEDVAARLLDDVDDPAHTPGPGGQQPGAARRAVDAVERALLVITWCVLP